jgi:hypothetical protein
MAVKAAAPKKTAPAKKAPAKKPVEPAADAAVFGVSDVADLIQVRTGKVVKTRDLRTLLRKMARDGRLDREIIAGNRERWVWSGAEDPEVEKIIEAYEAGELEADKQEKLAALKERKAEQRAAAKAAKEAEEADEDELEEEDE